jgi:hypothetical protein
LGVPRVVSRLIWWSRTLDTLATVEMCPVVAAASVVRVRTLRRVHQRRREALTGRAGAPWSFLRGWVRVQVASTFGFRPAQRIHEAKTSRLGVPRVVSRLIWWSRTLDTLATVEMCPVVAAAPVVRVRTCGGFTSAAAKRSQVALAYPGVPARLGAGAGRVDRTFSVIAALSRICTDQIRQTTTLAETKRLVLISGRRGAGRKANGGARSQRPSPHGHSCDAGNGSRSRPPDVCRHRGVVEGLHRRDEANDDSRQKKKRDRF